MRLLAASDLSATSDLAIRRALMLASECDGAATVLHVHGEVSERADLEQALRERVARIGPDANCEIALRVGTPFVEIIRSARAIGADLVVTGTRGAHWRPLSLTGSTAERVVRQGDRSVLVVRQRPIGSYERILIAVDASEHSTAALRFVPELFPDAVHRLVHAVSVSGESKLRGADPEDVAALHEGALAVARSDLSSALNGVWTGEPPALRYGAPAEVISELVVEWDADLVVVATHGKGFVPYVLLGSTAERVLRETPSDVLLFRPAGLARELP